MEAVGFFDVLLLDLVVKEPFVDLNPSEASLLNGFVLHLFGQLSIVFVEDPHEDSNLVIGLASAVVFDLLLLAQEG